MLMERAVHMAIESGAGLWAVLFILLLSWVLKTNNDREIRYQQIIERNQQVISEILYPLRQDVSEIKRLVGEKREVR